jgi:hypothetical protein
VRRRELEVSVQSCKIAAVGGLAGEGELTEIFGALLEERGDRSPDCLTKGANHSGYLVYDYKGGSGLVVGSGRPTQKRTFLSGQEGDRLAPGPESCPSQARRATGSGTARDRQRGSDSTGEMQAALPEREDRESKLGRLAILSREARPAG